MSNWKAAAAFSALFVFTMPVMQPLAQTAAKNQMQTKQMGDRVAARLKSILGNSADIKAYVGAYSKLQAAEKGFTAKERKKLLNELRSREITATNAEKVFDDMIKRLKETQALGDPNSEFVKLMNKAAEAARARAEKARGRGTERGNKMAEAFEDVAKSFIEARDRAIKARNDALPALAYIEKTKADYIDAIALQNFAEMAAIAEEAVAKVEQQSRQIQESARAMRHALGQDSEVQD